MGESVELEPAEVVLREGVEKNLEVIKRRIRSSDVDNELRLMVTEMGDLAHRLHMLLTERGIEPKHHKYMIKNRGMKPDDPEFYRHVHPVEDLLKFLDDVDSNADPVDQTIGAEFTFSVYSRRWGHEDAYAMKRVRDGWEVKHTSGPVQCDKEGEPGLYDVFRHDSINYPEALPGYLGYLWEQASDDGQGLSADELQEALTELANWVSSVERSSPRGLFRGYK